MFAQARQIHHKCIFKLPVHLFLNAFEIRIDRTLGEFTAEDFLPIRPPFDFLHSFAADQRAQLKLSFDAVSDGDVGGRVAAA